jgi:glycosyltransferase involved in cell wall biosynthesis
LKPLNLFYSEPDPDRWFKYDHYPRKIIRQLVRGKLRPGGVAMVSINLMKGLDKLGVPYRLNDYNYIRKHPDEVACIIGKPHVLFDRKWENPVLFGAGVYSHAVECPDLFTKYPNVKKILVPGEWMCKMFEPYYHDNVLAWPVGIDTDRWSPGIKEEPKFDFLVYDKVRWEHDKYQAALIDPICKELDKRSLSYQFIKYGSYEPRELVEKVKYARSVIFLCEHETQGLAYQQILATNTPILAWDRGGYWQDPSYYPEIKYGPVSSVPYWDEQCGVKFNSADDFGSQLDKFVDQHKNFNPREYIVANLTFEKCAEAYLDIYNKLVKELS